MAGIRSGERAISLAVEERALSRFRLLYEGMPLGCILLEPGLTITDWNPSAEEIFGWRREEALGRNLAELIVPPEARASHEGFLQELASGTESHASETENVTKEGRRIVCEWYDTPLRDEEGRLVGLLALARDVSERTVAGEAARRLNAELEERVERSARELAARSKELERFCYSISHDLRPPLRAIDGFSRMIEEEHAGALDDEGRRLLGVVRENARRMGRLIDDLLVLSRAGRHDMRRSRVDVAAMVRSVLEEVVPEPERERTEVTLGDLPPVLADPVLLRQVFVHLLSNAVKFTSARTRRVIDVSGRLEEGKTVYDVADNGVGFDMRYADKLFGVFQRLHGREFEGTGIGLALVERIVMRHGGTIRAEAAPDRGATFTLSFPGEGGTS